MIFKNLGTNWKSNGVLLVFFTALISGVSIFMNSFAVKGFDSSVFTFSKNIVAAVLLLCTIMILGQMSEMKKLSKRHWMQLVTIGFIGGSIPFLLFFKGLQMTTGTTSGFIHKTMFIWVGLLALIFLREKFDKRLPIAMALLLAGTWLMVKPDFSFTTGHLLIFGAVLLWSAENILSKKVLHELSGNIVAWGRMFFGSIFIMIFLTFTGKISSVFTMNSSQYLWILLTSALLYLYVLTYYNGLKHVSVVTATSILTLGAPITAIFSLNNSPIGFVAASGMVLLVLGVSVLLLKLPFGKWSDV